MSVLVICAVSVAIFGLLVGASRCDRIMDSLFVCFCGERKLPAIELVEIR
jgi:hypothetical protein